MTQLILYTSEDGKSQIQLRADGQTVWLNQMEMAELFSATKQNISLHLKNVFADGELEAAATVKESLTVQIRSKIGVSGCAPADQFRGVTKLIAYGKGGNCDLNWETVQ